MSGKPKPSQNIEAAKKGMAIIMENLEQSQRIIEFKKAIFGIDEKEVFEYIDLLNTNLNKAREVYEEKLSELKSANEMLIHERNSQNEKFQQLCDDMQSLQNENNTLQQTIDGQTNLSGKLNAALQKIAKLQEQIENCKQFEVENQRLNKQLTEIKVVSNMREQQQTTLLNEIETLKQQNKDNLASALEARSHLESDTAAYKLKITQMLQMHRFTLQQSREMLEKLVRLFDESCEYADCMDIS